VSVIVSAMWMWTYRVHHYVTWRQDDGRVHLDGSSKKHIGPVELVEYHRKNKAGLVIKLTCPCARPADMKAPYFWFLVTIDDFNDACCSPQVARQHSHVQ